MRVERFTYDGCDAPTLKDVDFTLRYGEVTLLSGLSGCGKSTLLSLINGVIPRMTAGELVGSVLLDGEDIAACSMSRISQAVGSVLQNAEAQLIHQTVEDEVAFGCENLGVAAQEIEQRIAESCRSMALSPDWKTRTLSGGQKQRLITAATLAMHPRILIFDEPLANLDQQGALDLLAFLRTLAQQGRAVLLVEHRLDVVLPYVDVVWELKDGTPRIVPDKQRYLAAQINLISDAAENDCRRDAAALSIAHVQKNFGARSILNDISLDVYAGARLLLLGENGCGKSTLLRILSRLLAADSGQVRQQLDPTLGKKAERRWFRAVGVVYQNPNYQLFMPTVREELLFGAEDEAYAMELARRFSLLALLERHPHSLSEGQKRRVTIAAILAQKPKLLLLDEPTVGQDYAGLREMVDEINAIHREQGNTMISVTHDFRCAAALCDEAVWLKDGAVFRRGGKELVQAFFTRRP